MSCYYHFYSTGSNDLVYQDVMMFNAKKKKKKKKEQKQTHVLYPQD